MEGNVSTRKVKYTYRKADDYKIIFANGVYGGITPRNELKFDFIHEYKETPGIEIIPVKEDGSPAPIEKEIPEEIEITRELKIGIILNLDQAESIGRWMLAKVEAFKKELEELKKLESKDIDVE